MRPLQEKLTSVAGLTDVIDVNLRDPDSYPSPQLNERVSQLALAFPGRTTLVGRTETFDGKGEKATVRINLQDLSREQRGR